MHLPREIAKHVRQVYFGGNWSANNLRDTLRSVDRQMAERKLGKHNDIATLVAHLGYYTKGVSEVLRGQPLSIRDKYSFDRTPLTSVSDWEARRAAFLAEGEIFAQLIERLDPVALSADFTDPKYGHYHANMWGIIEHLHYHLGQIVLLRNLLGAAPVT